jgi:aminoglycoside 6'-N-acetyltransferase
MGMAQSRGPYVELSAYVAERHADLLGSWLRQPHVAKWWGDPDEALREVSKPPAAGGEALITVDGSPVGYLRWQTPCRSDLDAAGLQDVPLDAVDIDIVVGEADWLGRGVGSSALMFLVERLVADGATTIMLATSVENRRAVRAYEKAGFTCRRQFTDTDGGTYWLMTIEAGRQAAAEAQ